MHRRALIKNFASISVLSSAAGEFCSIDVYSTKFSMRDRLDEGPIDLDPDEGGSMTALFTVAPAKPLRNPGLGLVGYTSKESGPSLSVPARKKTSEEQVAEATPIEGASRGRARPESGAPPIEGPAWRKGT